MADSDFGTHTLSLEEGVELGNALVSSMASSIDVRVLLIKGAALQDYGLRAPHQSTDIDALVDPIGFDRFCQALVANGWQIRPRTFIHAHYAPHSETFQHPLWPCDIDVHRYFPGFLAPAETAFDELWGRRQPRAFAHTVCSVPDRDSSLLILALHSLRSTKDDPRHQAELDGLYAPAGLDSTSRADLLDLARRTGCVQTLSSVLGKIGIDTSGEPPAPDSDALRRWEIRVRAGGRGAHFWLLALADAPPRARLRLLWRAFWPTREDLEISRPWLPDSFGARFRARLMRLTWGLSTLPPAIAARIKFKRPQP